MRKPMRSLQNPKDWRGAKILMPTMRSSAILKHVPKRNQRHRNNSAPFPNMRARRDAQRFFGQELICESSNSPISMRESAEPSEVATGGEGARALQQARAALWRSGKSCSTKSARAPEAKLFLSEGAK